MKTSLIGASPSLLTWIAAVLLVAETARASVTFTVTPAAISNTYNGPITLTVTGLTNSETVIVQKFFAASAGGAAGAGGPLLQQFQLTDGQAGMVIGGVTNFNVPGDTDPTAGQITARLYPSFDFAQVIVGTYLFVLSSPSLRFAPQTNAFSVTNYPFAQTITGQVLSGGAPVPNAGVILFPGYKGGSPRGGVVANGSGVYAISAPTGTYNLVAFSSNFVALPAPTVALGAGQTVTTNVLLTPGTQTLSGKLVDANNPSLGLSGCFVPVISLDHQFLAIASTDGNGNFSARVTPGQWKVGGDDATLLVKGYLNVQNRPVVDTTTGDVSGLTIALARATALFYGAVRDNLGTPLPGVAIFAHDSGETYEMDGFSGTNGNYVATAIAGSGTVQWELDEDYGGPANYVYSAGMNGISLATGQAYRYDFTGILATNHIAGSVQFNGNAVGGVGVNANATINGVNYNSHTGTDGSGHYSLNVANGDWNVSVHCGGGSDGLDNILGNGTYQCPNNQNSTIYNTNSTVSFLVQPAGSGKIYGHVADGTGKPVPGVNVDAGDGMGHVATGITDATGAYSINVATGTWSVGVDCADLSLLGFGCPGSQPANVSGGSVVVDFTVQPCGSLHITTTDLPDGMVGFAYYAADTNGFPLQNDGCGPFTWSLSPGSLSLPQGLSLSSGGVISGTPSRTGTNYFAVRVTNPSGQTADQPLSVVVDPALSITNASLPDGIFGVNYSADLQSSGGGGPGFMWQWYIASGSLPPGLGYGSSGGGMSIYGTPGANGTFSFVAAVQDGSGYVAQRSYSITIRPPSVQITTASFNDLRVGVGYTNQLQASGGTPPYAWAIANGSQPLPGDLTLSTSGVISGVPRSSGTFSFIVQVTDANSLSATRSVTVVVNAGVALSRPTWLSNGFSMWLSGASNQSYAVEMATNLSSTNWTLLFVTNNPTTNSFFIVDPNATNGSRFYRAVGQ